MDLYNQFLNNQEHDNHCNLQVIVVKALYLALEKLLNIKDCFSECQNMGKLPK